MRPRTWPQARVALEAAGLSVVRGRKHWKVVDSAGVSIAAFPMSASDRRSVLNFVSEMRRKGYDLDCSGGKIKNKNSHRFGL